MNRDPATGAPPPPGEPPAAPRGLLLALDAGSPRVSVALGRGGQLLACRAVPQQHSSTQLLALVAEVLAAAGARPRDLAGVVALAGPGSFTGLRVALATALGFHQALGMPALALPTLAALAALARLVAPAGDAADRQAPTHPAPPAGDQPLCSRAAPAGDAIGGAAPGATVVAAVDALRGEWSAQAFAAGIPPRPLGGIELLPAASLLHRLAGRPATGAPADAAQPAGAPATLVAFGVAALAAAAEGGDGVRQLDAWDAPPLAEAALRLAAAVPLGQWRAAALAEPIYSRPPAATLPRPRPAAAAPR